MRKKAFAGGALVLLMPVIVYLSSCSKSQPFFTYRYVITQLTIDNSPSTDTVVAVTKAGLRLWMVPERYYDRFALHSIPGISAAYAGNSGIFGNKDKAFEENDSIMSIDVWLIPEDKTLQGDSVEVLNANVRYRVDGEKKWTNQKQALNQFNEKANTNNPPQYIDVDFDKFTLFTGRKYYGVQVYTKKKTPYPVYSTSVVVNLKPY